MTEQEFLDTYYVERKHSDSLKWNELASDDLIPMWIADMDFKSPYEISDAIDKRLEHGVFGYPIILNSYYESLIRWEKNQNNYELKKEYIRISPSVVTSICWLINCFTKKHDSIIILTPVYSPFSNSINDNGRNLITVDLNYKEGIYTIDFEEFEKNIIENNVKMFILCSPHNPIGRVWHEEELENLLSICQKHNVLVISDEIHKDLIRPDLKHIPSAIINNKKYVNNIITLSSASKTFNIPIFNTSNVIIENDTLRESYDKYINTIYKAYHNQFGIIAHETVYNNGLQWRNDLLKVVHSNYNYIKETLTSLYPKIFISPMEGTYLLWMNLREYVDLENIQSFIQDKCKLAVCYGETFGSNWKGFIRMNMATHPKIIKEATQNIINNLNKLNN